MRERVAFILRNPVAERSYGGKPITVGKEERRSSFPHAQPTAYRGIPMRSKLEAEVAKELDAAEIRWLYEPRMPFRKKTYVDQHFCIPDFFLYDYKVFVEVRPEATVDENLNKKCLSIREEYGEVFIINTPKDVKELIAQVLRLKHAVNY
jgi:hypothetical protein